VLIGNTGTNAKAACPFFQPLVELHLQVEFTFHNLKHTMEKQRQITGCLWEATLPQILTSRDFTNTETVSRNSARRLNSKEYERMQCCGNKKAQLNNHIEKTVKVSGVYMNERTNTREKQNKDFEVIK
jgi:hypothetical protein